MDLQIRPEAMEIETTWGTIAIELVDGKVCGCMLPFLPAPLGEPFAIVSRGDDPVSTFVAAVFSGKSARCPALAEPSGTEFQKEVWRGIAGIPSGQTKTYGELAKDIGRPKAVRAVGSACGKNPLPLFIPCHRVVGSKGGLGGFSAGLPWKRFLMEAEAAT